MLHTHYSIRCLFVALFFCHLDHMMSVVSSYYEVDIHNFSAAVLYN